MERKRLSKDKLPLPDVVFHAEIIKSEHDEDDKKNDDFFIEGFASTENIDRVNEVVLASAFKKSLKQFMKNPVLLLHHGFDVEGRSPVGKIVEAEIIEGKGLKIKAFISKTEEKLRTKIEEGLFKAFSFGFRILDSVADKVRGINISKITNLELLEISVVSIPANRQALFSVAKAFELGSDLIYKNEFVDELNTKVDQLVNDVKTLKGVDWTTTTATTGYVKEIPNEEINKVIEKDNFKEIKESLDTIIKDLKAPNDEEFKKQIELSQEKVEELKAGQVLSSKNKSAITKAVEAIEQASIALKGVLELSTNDSDVPQPKKEIDSKDDLEIIIDEKVQVLEEEIISKALEGVIEQVKDVFKLMEV